MEQRCSALNMLLRKIDFSALIRAESALFTEFQILLSQAAACDDLIFSVNYNGQKSGMQGYSMPLIEG